jgi:SAM-dependent methyltransferase
VEVVRRATEPVPWRVGMNYPERIVPDETEPGVVALHLARYEFAKQYCVGHTVLDVGCGVGYGSAWLGSVAHRVVGVDASAETIAYARERYGAPNVEFVAGDATQLPHASESFDVVCAFETIEHLDDPDAAVAEAARVLETRGTLLASTPNVRETTHEPANPWHRVEYSRADFEQLLSRHFAQVELFGQVRLQTRRHRLLQRLDILALRRKLTFLRPAWRLVGTRPTAEVTPDDIVISQDNLEHANELIAVCIGPRKASA